MRQLLITILLSISVFSFAQSKRDSITEKKLDTLLSLIMQLQDKKNDALLIKVDKLEEIFKKTEPGWYDKYLPALIAFFTVLISSGVAYYVGMRNARTQISNAETQARTQIAIAADQLDISRKQIEQTAKNTLEQVRANNISQARITWLNELRQLLSQYISESSRLIKELARVKTNRAKGIKIDSKQTEQYVNDLYKIQGMGYQVILYLSKTDENHRKLEQLISSLFKMARETEDRKAINLKAREVLEQARVVLKQTWEEAKKEMIFKP